ncbi:MarR family winged helix-turn-helix transcriptional regulator [Streptomyces sp. NPDC002889]|uniref:MarR family winged helix-turn-helix transcriptional regulator n=1 Tax=Streptomyces sp. NPDC002889 TaxID=3364669 RepID=UPI0036CFE14A
MDTKPASPPRCPYEAARAACDVVEVLEVVWERCRDTASLPVSTSQLRVLYALEREEGINLRTLGEMLGSTPSSVSRLCDRLTAVGLVERCPSPVSRRELELHLTSSGKSYLRELRERRELDLTPALDAMQPQRREDLLKGLQGLWKAFDEAEPARV